MVKLNRRSIGDWAGRQVEGFLSAVSPAYRERCERQRYWKRQLDWAEQRMDDLHKRVQTRNRQNVYGSAYWDAADDDRFRGHDWMVSKLSVNSALEKWWEEAVERSEDLYRNNPYAASAINGRVKNVVGCGFTPQARVVDDDNTNNLLESIWTRWAEIEKISLKMRQAERCVGMYGEAFVFWSDVPRKGAHRDLPTLHVQVISPKRIETPGQFSGDKDVRMGVRLDPKTREPIGYYIRKGIPGDTLEWSQEFDYVPASRMFHQFEPLFPGQVRGVPWLAPAMPALKDLEDFIEAYLIAEQAAACHMGFIYQETGSLQENLRGAAATTDADGNYIEDFSPGTIVRLKKGEKIDFSNPNRPGNTLEPFALGRVREVAAAIDYPYELLAKHFENNFSGGRLALIDGRIGFKCWQKQSVDALWAPVWREFVDRCSIMGYLPVSASRYAMAPHMYQVHRWSTPGWPWVDPDKEGKGNKLAVDEKFKTRSGVVAEGGGDYEEILKEREREMKAEAESEARIRKYREDLGLAPDPSQPEPTTNATTDQEEEEHAAAAT